MGPVLLRALRAGRPVLASDLEAQSCSPLVATPPSFVLFLKRREQHFCCYSDGALHSGPAPDPRGPTEAALVVTKLLLQPLLQSPTFYHRADSHLDAGPTRCIEQDLDACYEGV